MTKATSRTSKGKSAAKKASKPVQTVPETVSEEISENAAAEEAVKPATETETTSEGEVTASGDEAQTPGSDTATEAEGSQSATTKKKVAIVIPYLKSKAQGSELLYAIRSIAKNFTEESFQLVVIGDKEDWFGDEILFIEHTCIGNNPQVDVLDKMKAILVNEGICEHFIWTNDDIYFVSPTSLMDILMPKTDGHLQKEPYNTSQYNANRGKTIDLLLSRALPVRNFDTHMPFLFSKDQMMDVFEAFPEMNYEGLLIASMYFNYHVSPETATEKLSWSSDKWMLRVISGLETEEKKEKFRQLIGTKHFLNHSEAGFSKLLMNWLEKQFPEKSLFEK